MRQNHILSALAIFSISLLVMFSFITNPQNMAFAVGASDFNFGGVNFETFYQAETSTYVSLQKTTATANTKVCFVDAEELLPASEQSCIVIAPQKDGCDISTVDPVNYNQCNNTGGTTDCDTDFPDSLPCSDKTGITGNFGGLWCGATYCFILFESASATYSDQLLRIWSLGRGHVDTGKISGYLNITLATTNVKLYPYIWGWDECNQSQGGGGSGCGIGGITLYWSHLISNGSTIRINRAGGTSLMGIVNTVDTVMCGDGSCVAGHTGVTGISGCRHCGGSPTTTRVLIVARAPQDTARNVVLYNEALAEQASFSTTNQLGNIAMSNADGVAYLGNTKNLFIIAQDSTLRTISTAGAVANSYTYASVGFVNYVKGIGVDEDLDSKSYYVYHGSTASLTSVTRMNITSITTVIDFDSDDTTISDTISGWVDGGQGGNSIAVNYKTNTILMVTDSAKARILYLKDFSGQTFSGDSTVCVDTNQDGSNDFCFNDTNGDGTPDAVGGLLQIVAPTRNVTSVAGTFGCGLGLSSCSNLDVKTNGMGYILMLLLLVFLGGLTMFFSHKTRTPITEVHPVFWIVLVLGVTGASWQLNWTDAIAFFTTILGIASFGGIKIAGYLRGG